jgi:hypothetical protein
MRLVTIPLLGALALSLTVADPAAARPRFGPGAILGAFAGLFGVRHAHRYHRHAGRARAYARAAAHGRAARPNEVARVGPPQAHAKPAAWAGPVFWPHAADDLFGYALFPNAGERFWAYSDILADVFADQALPARSRGKAGRNRTVASASPTDNYATEPSADLCGSANGSNAADAAIERIDQVVTPTEPQRALLAPLRNALTTAGARIKAVCPAELPTNPPQRLDAIQDRIGAMRDAALTVRVPLENFYNSLSEEQKGRLRGRGGEATATQSAGEHPPANCAGSAGRGDSGAIERLVQPTPEQRAGLQALQMQFAGLAQLVASSCPAATPASPVERLAAAGDRLTTMLFAVMSAGPAVQSFYDSLSDEQKANIANSMRRRAGARA